ncbi:phytoene/squalene synthase family protein [Marinigracilibium pacificum]|uniref:Phytoene/squalene synthase family protein n=1 Tax=Marinigracilibium pacificum TaxID=2729599 RepID=A0A848J102_9BACT|nr:phytoene/squalene synthase family protein [Marinigracilibium pacificum]NMM46922.1 phytoene/squalene synthase family protein [Marinigracilibium pacificum]
MIELFNKSAFECSKRITELYSTSFTLGIKTLSKRFHDPIFGIYGYVRYADEIVDTFHHLDKEKTLLQFEEETYKAIEEKFSMNPVLHSFQLVVNSYNIEQALIKAFIKSMRMDIYSSNHNIDSYDEYIYGSAEVVGLMCLRVFCEGNDKQYNELKPSAMSLGSAFQKVNFLRDLKSDYEDRGRVYFPEVDFNQFTKNEKWKIEKDIEKDFDHALTGILNLPDGARAGVYLAYLYYRKLFNKIKKCPPHLILENRVRIPNFTKLVLLGSTYFKYQLRVI